MRQDLTSADDRAAALLRVASYLGRPQKFMAVADARAQMRRTLAMVAKGSVALTTREPEAADALQCEELFLNRHQKSNYINPDQNSVARHSPMRYQAVFS